MATQIAHRTEEKTGNWSSIFPNEIATSVQSTQFVKKLLAVAVSNIAYLRSVFPENAFGDRRLKDLNLKILRDDKFPGASQVIKWMEGCFDALDKKYLKVLIIGLYTDPDDPEKVIESYTFKFTYTEKGGVDIYRNDQKVTGAHSEHDIRKATQQLLRNIILLTQTLDVPPDDVMMTMKLLYYDEVTPSDYEPPGFRAGEDGDFSFAEEPLTLKVGDVNTAFHSLKVRVKTDKRQFSLDGNDPPVCSQASLDDAASQHTHISTGLDGDISLGPIEKASSGRPTPSSTRNSKPRAFQEPTTAAGIPGKSPAKPAEMAVDTAISESSQKSTAEEEFKVRCPCGCNEDDGLMILCEVCRFWQHGVCFQVLEECDAPSYHVCEVCAQDGVEGKEPTDHSLVDLSTLEVQGTCLWRRTLVACLDLDRVVAPALATRLGTEVTVAQGLINRLSKEGFLKPANRQKKLGRLVDKDKIKDEGLPMYMLLSDNYVHSQPSHAEHQVEVIIEEPPQTGGSIRKGSEVDNLIEKTEGLQLNKMLTGPSDKQVTTSMKSEGGRRGKKRSCQERDAVDLEISNTQDDFQDEKPKRRKKCSIPTKDIAV